MPRKKFTTYIEEDTIKEIKKLAIDKEVTVADILNDLLSDYIKKEKQENEFNK